MWKIAIACACLAACGSSTKTSPDGAPGMIDARTAVDAGVCVDENWGGTYSLEWACVGGCESDAPYHYMTRLTITGSTAAFDRDDCGDCAKTDSLTFDGNCFTGDGLELGNGEVTDPYTICAEGCSASGDVSWTGYPGPLTLSTWRATLSR